MGGPERIRLFNGYDNHTADRTITVSCMGNRLETKLYMWHYGFYVIMTKHVYTHSLSTIWRDAAVIDNHAGSILLASYNDNAFLACFGEMVFIIGISYNYLAWFLYQSHKICYNKFEHAIAFKSWLQF